MASNFNYDTAKEQIDRQRALSNALFRTPYDTGRMVTGGPNGFYAAPSKLGTLATMLTQLAGVYGMGSADDAQKKLDSDSATALSSALNDAPWKDTAVAAQNQREALAEMLRESRRGDSGVDAGQTVGAEAPQPTINVQTPAPMPAAAMPVPAVAPSRAAPRAPSRAAPRAPAAQSGFTFNQAKDSQAANIPVDPNSPSDRSILAPGAFDNLMSIAASAKKKLADALSAVQHFTGADGSKPNVGPAPQPQVQPAAQPAAQPAPTAPIPAQTPPATPQNAPVAAQTLATQLAPAEPAPVAANASKSDVLASLLNPHVSAGPGQAVLVDGSTVQLSDPRMLTEQAAASAQPTQAERIQRLERMANSGPMGRVLAQAQLATYLQPSKYDFKEVKNADGSSTVLGINERDPRDVRQVATGAGGNSIKQAMDGDKIALEVLPKLEETKQSIADVTSQKAKALRGIELMAQLAPGGGLMSTLAGKVRSAFGDETYTEMDMLLKGLAFGDLKSNFGGNPTEGERKAQLEVKAAYERGQVPSINALNTLISGYDKKIKIQQGVLDQYQGMYDQYRSKGGQQPAAPATAVPDDWRSKWAPKR